MSYWKIVGVVAVAAAGAMGAIFGAKRKSSASRAQAENASPEVKPLGRFVVWGRPDSGKTTFIFRLLEKEPLQEKVVTDSKERHQKIKLGFLKDGPFMVDEIVDMPGNLDRRADWIERVLEANHAFYLVNLEKLDDSEYLTQVRLDIKETVLALEQADKKNKKINLIATHLDTSLWRDIEKSRVNNVMNEDMRIRQVREARGGVKGEMYSVNLMDKKDFEKLMQDVVNDISN